MYGKLCQTRWNTLTCNRKAKKETKNKVCQLREAHPPSYQGRSVAKELQTMTDDALRKQKVKIQEAKCSKSEYTGMKPQK